MPYYHITNTWVKKAADELLEQYAEQNKAFQKVLRKFKTKEGFINDRGMTGIKVKDPSKVDKKAWCSIDKSRYSNNKCIRPNGRTKAGAEVQAILDTVPKLDRSRFHGSLNFKPVFVRGRYLSSLNLVVLKGKNPHRYVVKIPDYAVGKIDFPKGVKEITFEKYEKWEEDHHGV